MVLIIDGVELHLSAAYVDHGAEWMRIAQAVFRCEVEQLHLAGGRIVLVNWRAVRIVELRAP